MKISIIIPVYNGAFYLREMLDSITQQKRKPDEVILSNDESKDNSLSIIEEFAKTAPFEVRILQHKPSGVTNNYLNAARAATGDIVIVADQDDWLHENRLFEVELAFISNPSATLISSDSEIVSHDLESLGRTVRKPQLGNRDMEWVADKSINFSRFLRGGLPTLAHTLSFRSYLLPYLLKKPVEIENWWFEEWLSCVAACLGEIRLIPQVHTYYRQHQNQTSKAGTTRKSFIQNNSAKFAERLYKMVYCLNLIEDNGGDFLCSDKKNYREKILGEYIEFLQKRNELREETIFSRTILASRMMLAGYYSKYSRGVYSFLADILVLESRK